MLIYVIILIVLLFLIKKYDINENILGYGFSYITMLLVFVLVAGLRYKIGSDTLVYMDEYTYYPDLSQLFQYDFTETRYDFLWVFFCALCKSISGSYFFMQFIHAIIINSIYFYFIYKNTKYRFTALFIYFILGFLYFNTEILRESLAVAFFLLAIRFFYEKKWTKYYLLVLIASLFHSSALIVLLFPLLSKIKLNMHFIISLLVVAALASVIWGVFNEYIQLLYNISSIEDKADAYLNNDAFIYNFNGILYGLFTYVLIPLLCVLFYRKYFKDPIDVAPFIWLYIAFGIFIVFNNTIFTRFQNYLFFPFIIFFSNLWNESRENKERIIIQPIQVMTLFFLLLFGSYYNYFKMDVTETTYIYQRYIPYHSILQNEFTIENNL